jgi:hypothetical protein
VILNDGNPEKGVIISHLFNKNSLNGKKNGNLIFDDFLFKDQEFKNQWEHNWSDRDSELFVEIKLKSRLFVFLPNKYLPSNSKVWFPL